LFTNSGDSESARCKEIFTQAVDQVAQVGWLEKKRKILGMWETTVEMKAGNVVFRQVYKDGVVELGKMKNCANNTHVFRAQNSTRNFGKIHPQTLDLESPPGGRLSFEVIYDNCRVR